MCGVSLDVASLSQKGGSRTNTLPGSADLPETGNGVGDNSLSKKAEDEQTSRCVALQDPPDMVKAKLLEAQPRLDHASPAATLVIAASPVLRVVSAPENDLETRSCKVRGRKHQVMNLGVGVSGRPKSGCSVTSGKARLTVGVRTPRQRSLHSSSRSGKPATGQEAQAKGGRLFDVQKDGGTRDAKS
jgi:hypothetical protein